MAARNDVTKGVYGERYGKWERRIGDRGGEVFGDVGDVDEFNSDDSDEKNERCKFQMWIKWKSSPRD